MCEARLVTCNKKPHLRLQPTPGTHNGHLCPASRRDRIAIGITRRAGGERSDCPQGFLASLRISSMVGLGASNSASSSGVRPKRSLIVRSAP